MSLIPCPNCNRTVNSEVAVCPHCHRPVIPATPPPTVTCPACGSAQFVPVQGRGGYSGGLACCGMWLMGPFGLLCGNLTNGASDTVLLQCASCGHRWNPRANQDARILRNWIWVFLVTMLILFVLVGRGFR